jgi:RUN domain
VEPIRVMKLARMEDDVVRVRLWVRASFNQRRMAHHMALLTEHYKTLADWLEPAAILLQVCFTPLRAHITPLQGHITLLQAHTTPLQGHITLLQVHITLLQVLQVRVTPLQSNKLLESRKFTWSRIMESVGLCVTNAVCNKPPNSH